jgi:hypothetical protein
VWRGRGTAPCRAPPQVGRAPMGPAGVAESVSAPQGLETAWGVLEIPAGIVTSPGEGAHGFRVPLRALDRSASA